MAAAYAALVSLTHTIEHSMVHNARQPIFLDKQQRQMESLQQKVSFLQDFLEVYSNGGSNDAEVLESRIADAAYAAEDIIESHVVDNIVSQTQKQQIEKKKNEKISSSHFSQGLQKVIENIDCIRNAVMEIKQRSDVEDQPPRELLSFVSSRPLPAMKDTVVEYYKEDLEQIMDMLTGQSSNLLIIPIVGMGGIGKTTLARNVYEDPLVVECFYIRAWVTISQEYDLRALLLGLLREIGISNNERDEEEQNKGYHQFGEKLYKHLSGRKYLIIMDDIWGIEVLEKLKLFFPDNDNGSRVMVTTRLLNVADSSGSSHLYKMNLLNENKSWSLLRRKVFGHDGDCPPELEETGKDIARNCKGLPLSIVVIGGLLAKSEMTRTYWEYVAKYINQIVNSEDSGRWLKILSLSYNHLPIHLKPCFLYMGVYREDCEIRISELIKLWVAEGFVKPNSTKSLEEVAEDYLKDLVERNLILVRQWGSIGKMKTCGIHDLLRDLCLKEAKKERFLSVVKLQNYAQSIHNSRMVFHKSNFPYTDSHHFHRVLQSTPFIHSLTCDDHWWNSSWVSLPNLRLLRILTGVKSDDSLKRILQLVNLRYLKCHLLWSPFRSLFPMCQLWYLQTLIIAGSKTENIAPTGIWEMPQLRHIIVRNGICLPDPLPGRMDGHDDPVLKNLQTLSHISNFKCSEEVLKRIPNIKKLSIDSDSKVNMGTSNCNRLHNLGRLHKLQSLTCHYLKKEKLYNSIVFPQSLKKLSLQYCYFDWDDLTEKVGSLRHLEKLKLGSCIGGADWNTVEGKFLRLKFLEIGNSSDLVCWTAESSHFPLLERLVLIYVTELKEIPSGIGDTLQSIELVGCSSSIIASAQEIVEDQQSFGNEDLRLIVRLKQK